MQKKFLFAVLASMLLGTFVLGQAFAAEECKATSPAKKNALVELFTSDGCDSCPPANKWLSDSVKRGDKTLIPVSMHVTYWNYLGWKDRFSHGFFDERQDAYAKQAIHKFSYTPELFVNGQEWREWNGDSRFAIDNPRTQAAPVSISLAIRPQAGALSVEATVEPVKGEKIDLSAARLYFLLYEDNLIERPNAGELKGAALRHDHVVRDWKISDVQAGKISQQFSVPPGANRKNLGIVAFVQGKDLKSVYQAVDLPLCFN
ncbi:MAG TPA: DUF1223 domain-containing protein [Burkholderiales bacterium]|nr:DUF1223 domain-containing protein [Burkholderiales bacterium]